MRRLYHKFLASLLAFSAVLFLAYPVSPQLVPDFITQDSILPVRSEHNQSLGSSVAYGPVVLTARHIVTAWKKPLYIHYRDTLLSTEVLCDGSDEIDFAVLFVQGLASSMSNGQARLPDTGEIVWIAGYPKGRWTARPAVVIGVEENVKVYGQDGTVVLKRVIGVVDPTRSIDRPGISGGGVFNGQGELVGVVCCIRGGTGWLGVVPLVDGLRECTGGP